MTGVPLRAAADWLELRGPADEEARDRGAAHLLTALTAALERSGARSLQVVDLGAGTGANRRYLGPRLPLPQAWVVVDHDADHLRHPVHEDALRLQAGVGDDAQLLEDVDVPDGAVRLLTCAALLDVLTEEELAGLARLVVDGGGPALFALSVDGRVRWSPVDPDDELVGRAFDRHQQRDDRLGPVAAAVLSRRLTDLSPEGTITLQDARTDWQLGPSTPQLLGRWLDERVAAALDQEPGARKAITAWHARRRAQLGAGGLQVQVGHTDLLVLPSEGATTGK